MVEWLGRTLGIAITVLVVREALREGHRQQLMVVNEQGALGGEAGAMVHPTRERLSRVGGVLREHYPHIAREVRTIAKEAREALASAPQRPVQATGTKGGSVTPRKRGRPRKTAQIASVAGPGDTPGPGCGPQGEAHRFGRCPACRKRWYEHG